MRNRFTSKSMIHVALIGISAILLVLSSCSRPKTPPNVILIVIDTLRADRVGCYGYDRIGTPYIDELARSGVRFENVLSHVPITLPSLSTIMTSALPPTTGVHGNEGFRLDDHAVTLAEILKEDGYETRAVVGAVVLDSLNGIAQGFDRYDDNFEAGFTGYNAYVEATRPLVTDTQRRAEEVTRIALEMVDSMEEGRPFFLFVHYFDPHTPYDPPLPYSLVDPAIDEDSYEYQLLMYDGEIAYTDEHIGRFLIGLKERGILDKSLVVLTADHGESLGEHREHTHAFFAYEQTLRVPLVFSLPGTIPQGEVVEELSGLIDVAPTILDIVGISGREDERFHGSSLYPFGRDGRRKTYYFECVNPFIIFGCSGIRGVHSRGWKYFDLPREELYNLSDDPRELSNRIDQNRTLADSLRGEMIRILSEIDIYRGENGGEMSLGGAHTEDNTYRERLLALGYVATTADLNTSYESMFDKGLADPKERIDQFNLRLAVRARINVAGFHLYASEFDECLQMLDGLEGIGDRQWVVHYYRGLAFIGKRDNARAREELVSAVDSAPVGPERVRIRETMRYLDMIERSGK